MPLCGLHEAQEKVDFVITFKLGYLHPWIITE